MSRLRVHITVLRVPASSIHHERTVKGLAVNQNGVLIDTDSVSTLDLLASRMRNVCCLYTTQFLVFCYSSQSSDIHSKAFVFPKIFTL